MLQWLRLQESRHHLVFAPLYDQLMVLAIYDIMITWASNNNNNIWMINEDGNEWWWCTFSSMVYLTPNTGLELYTSWSVLISLATSCSLSYGSTRKPIYSYQYYQHTFIVYRSILSIGSSISINIMMIMVSK